MTWSAADYQFMSRAIQLARRGRYTCDPNPRVGCVITKDNQLLAEAWHALTGEAHAEINALNACDDASGSTVYLSLEPCSHHGHTPPCVDALINAKVKEVVVAMLDPNPMVSGNGIKRLEASGITVKLGLLEEEALKLNAGFIKRMTQARPFVRCKMAMSLDGRTALATGESQWISCEASRRDVHKLRAASSAILTSSETVIEDDALLNARDLDMEFKPAYRVVVDRKLKISAQAKLFSISGNTSGQVIIYTEKKDAKSSTELIEAGAEIVVLPESDSFLADVISHLATEYEINEVMVEAGASFSGALIEAGLVDEVILYVAPKLLGHDASPLLKLTQIDQISNARQLHITDFRKIDKDLRITLTV